MSVGRFLLYFLELVIFDHRIREQIATKSAQPFLKIDIFAINLYFHVLADPDAAHFRHSQMSHRVADGISLRIEHRFLRFDDHVNFHVSHVNAVLLGNKRKAVPLRH